MHFFEIRNLTWLKLGLKYSICAWIFRIFWTESRARAAALVRALQHALHEILQKRFKGFQGRGPRHCLERRGMTLSNFGRSVFVARDGDFSGFKRGFYVD